jgi:hypothetical protein
VWCCGSIWTTPAPVFGGQVDRCQRQRDDRQGAQAQVQHPYRNRLRNDSVPRRESESVARTETTEDLKPRGAAGCSSPASGKQRHLALETFHVRTLYSYARARASRSAPLAPGMKSSFFLKLSAAAAAAINSHNSRGRSLWSVV